jgi:hypothetical protein
MYQHGLKFCGPQLHGSHNRRNLHEVWPGAGDDDYLEHLLIGWVPLSNKTISKSALPRQTADLAGEGYLAISLTITRLFC